jgi:predicted NBD/HSP70 family sugar kinase
MTTNANGSPPVRALPRLDLLRELTDQSVLDVVFTTGAVTRAEIARQTGISKPTINEAVRRLERVGLLRPAGSQTGRPGRVATFYEVASDAGFVVAVDLNPSAIGVTAGDLFGATFAEWSYPPPRQPAGVADQLRAAVATAVERGRAGSGPLLAVAVSVANPVDPSGAVIALADTPYPEGLIQPAEVLAGQFDVPLLVENDVNLAAIAERFEGAGRDIPSFAYLHVGAGLGLGLIINGTLVRGSRGAAGEIGYLSLGFGSPDEHDRHGLARAVAAHGFAPRRRGDELQDAITVARDVFDRAATGDAEALAVIEREGQAIGEAAAAVCAIVDPDLIILGGPIGTRPTLLPPVQRTVDKLAPIPTPVLTGTIAEAAPLRGALALALQRARADLWARNNDGRQHRAPSRDDR